MHIKNCLLRFIALLLLACLLVSCVGTADDMQSDTENVSFPADSYKDDTTDSETLRAYVLNVGQSSCLVLKSGREYAVVDTGDRAHASYVFSAISNQKYIGTSRISYLFFTHYDADHIGAGPGIIQKLKVKNVYGPDYVPKEKSKTYVSLMNSIKDQGLKMKKPIIGERIILGDCTITIVAPSSYSGNENDNSIALLIEDDYGNAMYVGGDCEAKSEQKQVPFLKEVDVYIVNHHGAKESSSYDLLAALNPEYAIISCGRDNTYGHPHKETLDRLNNADCEIIYTYDVGEGENISFSFTKDGVKFLNK